MLTQDELAFYAGIEYYDRVNPNVGLSDFHVIAFADAQKQYGSPVHLGEQIVRQLQLKQIGIKKIQPEEELLQDILFTLGDNTGLSTGWHITQDVNEPHRVMSFANENGVKADVFIYDDDIEVEIQDSEEEINELIEEQEVMLITDKLIDFLKEEDCPIKTEHVLRSVMDILDIEQTLSIFKEITGKDYGPDDKKQNEDEDLK
jgi:hypothetical protein